MRRTNNILLLVAVALGGCSNGSVPLGGAQLTPRVAQATDLGRVPPSNQYDFVLGMRLRSVDQLHRFLVNKIDTGDVLSPDDFGDMFGPSAAAYARIAGWLQAQGLEVTRLVAGRTTISVRGSADAVDRAFNMEIHEYVDAAGNHFEAADRVPQFPIEVIDQVLGTVGLDGAPPWFMNHYVVDAGANPNLIAASQTGANLETLYKAPAASTNPGLGETIAILGAGLGPALATDLNGNKGYMATSKPYGLTAIPATGGYSVVNVGGPNRDPLSAAQGEQVENDLDADMVLAFAPYAKIVHVLTATNSPGLFTDGITYIVNNLKQAHQVTVSYGTCERGSAGEMTVMNALFAQAQAESQQWFFAAGDSGTDGCRDYPADANGQATGPGGNKVVSAGWPSSSPYAVSVGGTRDLRHHRTGLGQRGRWPERVVRQAGVPEHRHARRQRARYAGYRGARRLAGREYRRQRVDNGGRRHQRRDADVGRDLGAQRSEPRRQGLQRRLDPFVQARRHRRAHRHQDRRDQRPRRAGRHVAGIQRRYGLRHGDGVGLAGDHQHLHELAVGRR